MSFYRQFDEFDPLVGQPPEYPFQLLPSIAARARSLLTGWTRDQVISAANIADWMIEQSFKDMQSTIIRGIIERGSWELGYLQENDRNEAGVRRILEDWPSDADDSPPHFPTPENTSEVDVLRDCIGGYTFEDDSDFPNGQEWEYFAVLSLWKIADAIEWLKWDRNRVIEDAVTVLTELYKFPSTGLVVEGHGDKEAVRAELTKAMSVLDTPRLGHTDDGFRISAAGNSALEAMDAVTYAEHLKAAWEMQRDRDQFTEKKVQERVSIAASRAAIKRHAENRAMKQQVFEWCASHLHEYPSMDSAAEAVAGILVPVKFRTARTWIGEYRKREPSARRL